MGAGPKPILVQNLSVDRLAQAIAEAESKAIRERAQAVGQRIGGENGVTDAIKLIEAYIAVVSSNADSVIPKRVEIHAIF